MVDQFIDCKHGRRAIEYPHPLLADVLQETYGVFVYQEQVMLAAEEARSRPAAEVIVTGFSDAVGDAAANLALSRRRSVAFYNLARSEGLPNARLVDASEFRPKPKPKPKPEAAPAEQPADPPVDEKATEAGAERIRCSTICVGAM